METSDTATVEIVEIATRTLSNTVFENVTYDELNSEFLSIIDATFALNMRHPQYVRRLILEGRLEGIKIALGSRTKWFITKVSIAYYKSHTSRNNKARRYILKIKQDDEARLRDLLDEAGIEFELKVAYTKKRS